MDPIPTQTNLKDYEDIIFNSPKKMADKATFWESYQYLYKK